MSVRDLVLSAAGVSGAEPVYVEDVFSTSLYTGNGAVSTPNTQSVNHGINLGGCPCVDFRFVDGAPTGGAILNETISTKSGDWVVVFLVRSDTTAATCTINGAGVTAAASFIGAYNYRHTVFIQQVTTETTTVLTNTASLGHISCYVFRGPTSITVGQSLTATSGDTATTNAISSSGFGIILLSDRDEDSNPTASGTTTYGARAATYFQARAWGVSGNGTTIPATAISGLQGGSVYDGAYIVLNATGAGTNASDLGTGSGGMVWIKQRSASTYAHNIYDTVRGAGNGIFPNLTQTQLTYTDRLTAFTPGGYLLGSGAMNVDGVTHVSWAFRKQPKFFDVVTYTGDGSGASRFIPHSLGSVPGCVFIKSTSGTGSWIVTHRSLASNYYLFLNETYSQTIYGAGDIGNHTSSEIQVRGTNANGVSYVAYVFAHDAGGFGDSGSESVIKCGSFTTDSNGNATVNLGWEPQWVMIKRTDSSTSGDWYINDNMRNWPAAPNAGNYLTANSSGAEVTFSGATSPNSTGFSVTEGFLAASVHTFIYIAIRRGPMKTPTSGSSVFNTVTYDGNGIADRHISGVGFAPDLVQGRDRGRSNAWSQYDRLRGANSRLGSAASSEEVGPVAGVSGFDKMDGVVLGSSWLNTNGYQDFFHAFKRAPGFFDIVCYTGTGSGRYINHNLAVTPEMVVVKCRSTASTLWSVYHKGLDATAPHNKIIWLSSDSDLSSNDSYFGAAHTATQFRVGINYNTNLNGDTYVAYLFASCPGVSKVGSYTGTGTTLQVNCGFTSGARFLLIKRTDAIAGWYLWDSARGIVSGNDPYLLLNSTAAEVFNTDYIDTYSSGFEISSTAPAAINANGGNFIFLAIA